MKKRFLMLVAAMMTIVTVTGCGGNEEPKPENEATVKQEEAQTGTEQTEVPEVEGEIADAGNVQVLVPDGWMAFPEKDVFTDDPDDTNPNVLTVCKGASSEMDLFSNPYIRINYCGPGTTMLPPDKEYYEDAEDIAPMKLGAYTWNGFTAIEYGGRTGMIWTEDGDHQYQATMWLEVEGGKISLEDEDVQAILASVKPSDGSATVTDNSEDAEEPASDNGMAALISRFQGDWNGAMIFTDCIGAYEYLQDGWTSCLARFVIDEEGTIDPFIGLYVEDTPITNLKAWFDTDMECMMITGEWITVPFETRVTEYNGTINVVIDIENTAGSLSLVMNFRHLDDEGWTDEYPGLSPENVAYCKGKSFDELAVINGYEPGDYPEAGNSAGGAGASDAAVDLGEKEGADGHVELAVLKELLPWMKTETDYGMPYEEIAAKFGVHGKYVDTFENNGEQFVRYRWSADDDNRITITFYANPDGSETWNITTWDGLKD